MALKVLNQSYTLVGNVIIPRDLEKYSKTEAVGKNGWMRKNINFGIKVSEQNRIFVNQEAGFWSDEIILKTQNETGTDEKGKSKKKENFVYNGTMEEQKDGTKKYVADNIPFADRFLQENIDKVDYNKRIRVALEPKKVMTNNGENGEIIEEFEKDTDGNIVYEEKQFIFVGDAIDYIKAHLKNDDRVYVYVRDEINQYVNSKSKQLVTRVNRRIQQIRIARADEKNQSFGVANFLFTKDSFDKSEFKNTRKYHINGHKTFKQNDEVIPVQANYVLDFSKADVDWEDEKVKAKCEYLTEVFTDAKKDKVYQTQWRVMLFEGNDEVEIDVKDLSSDLQKRIKLGFITQEEAIKQARKGAVGNKIQEIKLVMPLGEESRVDTEIEIGELVPPSIDDKLNEIEEKKAEDKKLEDEKVKDVAQQFDDMFA